MTREAVELVRVTLVAVVVGWAVWLTMLVLTPVEAPVRLDYGTMVQEDDPRWDCRTMGNRVCGGQ